jgi:hypothetical protein
MIDFDPSGVTLPHTAFELCKEVKQRADSYLKDASPEDVQNYFSRFIGSTVEYSELASESERLVDAESIFNILDFVNDIEFWRSALDQLTTGSAVEVGLAEQVLELSETELGWIRGSLLMFLIAILASEEQRYLSKNPGASYEATAKNLSKHVLFIHKVYAMDKLVDIAVELFFKRLKPVEDGAKGGKRRHAKTNELKARVLNLDVDKFSHEIPAEAARQIYRYLDGALLVDEFGEDLLKNPPTRFADWISKARSEK